jgi:very-short-patch-repair endonuclease
MWALLRDRQFGGYKFRRQHSVPPFVLDFFCHDFKLGIELDGGQHYSASGRRADAKRSAYLARRGISLLRFSDRDVLRNTEAVLERLWEACHSRKPSP